MKGYLSLFTDGHLKVIIVTILALSAFAANSVLCRLALLEDAIDPSSFTSIRLISAVVMLTIMQSLRNGRHVSVSHSNKVSWSGSIYLFVYALTFSFAYTLMDTATGALVLFAAVQVTMVLFSYWQGKQLNVIQWIGLILAFCGFVYLMYPNINSPSLYAFILMLISGIAWAFYTINGQGSRDPLRDNQVNFLRTLPWVILLLILTISNANYTLIGVLLAVTSGAFASALGYFLWYIALQSINTVSAAVLQLFVPIIAALAGYLFLNELITSSFTISALMILGGVLLVTTSHLIIKVNGK